MEEEFNAIKNFIVEKLPAYVEKTETSDTPMPDIAEKNIIFGAVDITKYNSKVVVSVLPETQQESNETYINSKEYDSTFTVTFIIQGNKYDVLVRQMARFSTAFREALIRNLNLNNTMQVSDLGQRKFYTDVGSGDKQMTAFEIELTITTDNSFKL